MDEAGVKAPRGSSEMKKGWYEYLWDNGRGRGTACNHHLPHGRRCRRLNPISMDMNLGKEIITELSSDRMFSRWKQYDQTFQQYGIL